MRACLARTLYSRVSSTLLSKDRLLFALLLAVRPHLAQGDIGAVEWQFLLTGMVQVLKKPGLLSPLPDIVTITDEAAEAPLALAEHDNPAKTWLPDSQWNEMCSLATLPNFSGLIEEFEAQLKNKKNEFDILNGKSESDLWVSDLSVLEKNFNKFKFKLKV